MRIPYRTDHDTLDFEDITKKNPNDLFLEWFKHACDSEVLEPNAMVLATSTKSGIPSARYVLLKNLDDKGFTFFTNMHSRKGNELSENPFASLVFYWEPLRRQVRIEGTVSSLSEDENEQYFNSRPKDSRISACVSQQSQPVPNRNFLIQQYDQLQAKYVDSTSVPRPAHWGGYTVKPNRVEFWQGQTNRLHDRFVFRKKQEDENIDNVLLHQGDDDWVFERLAP
ncbi:hypothetical protein Ciccas_005320 [Cichlidogyrus casuarinus]|uniref:pyridoxal 5'-phosphate synthase n=1 Tax=Cichlidogyrus casuarinus TaxID=1844966 RepID=A0ABD2Q9E8_9PLAT